MIDLDVDAIRGIVDTHSTEIDVVIEELANIRQHIRLVLRVSLSIAVGWQRQAEADFSRTLGKRILHAKSSLKGLSKCTHAHVSGRAVS